MNFLNNGAGYTLFFDESSTDTYVDKSLLINEVYQYSRRIKKYICITRPRRFGKSFAANMIAAFFDGSTAEERLDLFQNRILPIAKYTSGLPLNMFYEFSAFEDAKFYPYFGLTDEEISYLMRSKGFNRPAPDELSAWYDGYIREDGVHIYNPASVSKALGEGVCKNNWTGTGPMNEIRDIIEKNVLDLREDIIRMAGGEELEIRLKGFSAEKSRISTRDEILSAMVVYGFLSYNRGKLSIPNHELLLKFQEALASEPMGLKQTIEESMKLLRAVLERDHGEAASLIEELQDDKIPFFNYNDENSLACVVTVGFLAALDTYRISREEKAGKGYVDSGSTIVRKRKSIPY